MGFALVSAPKILRPEEPDGFGILLKNLQEFHCRRLLLWQTSDRRSWHKYQWKWYMPNLILSCSILSLVFSNFSSPKSVSTLLTLCCCNYHFRWQYFWFLLWWRWCVVSELYQRRLHQLDKAIIGGHSQTTLTHFWPFLTPHPPLVDNGWHLPTPPHCQRWQVISSPPS